MRDPSLSALLALQVLLIFVVAPLGAMGFNISRALFELVLVGFAAAVVLLSRGRQAIVVVVFAAALSVIGFLLSPDRQTIGSIVVSHIGVIMALMVLTWVVAQAVFADGQVTFQRIQGAVVVYLNLALMFGSAYRMIWDLAPGSFVGAHPQSALPDAIATMLYFSLTTLTSTGYGDMVPLHPFARSLANLEQICGQLYPAVVLARLVTQELAGRAR